MLFFIWLFGLFVFIVLCFDVINFFEKVWVNGVSIGVIILLICFVVFLVFFVYILIFWVLVWFSVVVNVILLIFFWVRFVFLVYLKCEVVKLM